MQQLHPTFCLKLKEMCELKAATLGVSNEVIDTAKKKSWKNDKTATLGVLSEAIDAAIKQYNFI